MVELAEIQRPVVGEMALRPEAVRAVALDVVETVGVDVEHTSLEVEVVERDLGKVVWLVGRNKPYSASS